MRDLSMTEQRYQAVLTVIADGLSVSQLSSAMQAVATIEKVAATHTPRCRH
jgi:hypothetical protein